MPRYSAFQCLAAAAATLAAALLAPAGAAATSATLSGTVSPDHGPPGTPLTVTVGFTLTPDPGRAMTLAGSELLLPSGAVMNGRLFPVCTAATINARRGRFTDCPKGSQVGSGTLRADVPNAEVYRVPGRVTLFNGGPSRLTVHVYGTNPALISEALDATLVRTSGRYGYRLTVPVPYTLQEISDGWFVELRSFRATVGATRRIGGRTRGYVEATRCPAGGRAPIAASFSFLRESMPASAVGAIRCRP